MEQTSTLSRNKFLWDRLREPGRQRRYFRELWIKPSYFLIILTSPLHDKVCSTWRSKVWLLLTKRCSLQKATELRENFRKRTQSESAKKSEAVSLVPENEWKKPKRKKRPVKGSDFAASLSSSIAVKKESLKVEVLDKIDKIFEKSSNDAVIKFQEEQRMEVGHFFLTK